jgi:putative oxidoreductase
MNTGLLLIRLVVGLSLGVHGVQKMFGWLGGRGLRGTAASFGAIGYRAPLAMALLAASGECAGWLLVLGLAFPLGCAAGVGVMINAVRVSWGVGPHLPTGGYEYPLVVGVATTALAFTGPGRFSLDRAIGIHLYGTTWGLAALLAGSAMSAVVLLLFHRPGAPISTSKSAT